jgi:hypothetical protein
MTDEVKPAIIAGGSSRRHRNQRQQTRAGRSNMPSGAGSSRRRVGSRAPTDSLWASCCRLLFPCCDPWACCKYLLVPSCCLLPPLLPAGVRFAACRWSCCCLWASCSLLVPCFCLGHASAACSLPAAACGRAAPACMLPAAAVVLPVGMLQRPATRQETGRQH